MFSVTRLGNFLHFGQLFKACGNNNFAQGAHIFLVVEIFHFAMKSFLDSFFDILRFFACHTVS